MEPPDGAAYIALIARYTGWTEKYIMWKLPLCRGNAYCHAFMRMQNVDTQPCTKNNELRKLIDEI